MKCQNCGAEIQPGDNFCEVCGKRIEAFVPKEVSRQMSQVQSVKCPVCGSEVQPGDKFCEFCGAKIGANTSINSAQNRVPVYTAQQPIQRYPAMDSWDEGPSGYGRGATDFDVENSHEAIIPRALFLQVQEEMVRRARVKTGTGKRRVYSGKYALSHLVYCSDCGDLYRRTQWFLKGEHVPVWRCVSRLEKKKSGIDCPSRTIYEADLHAAVVTAFNQMIEQKDEFLPGMRLAVELALGQSNSPRVAEIDTRLEALQKELLKKANAKQGFEELADEIDALREEKQDLLVEDANRAAMKQRLDELEEFLDEHQEPVTDYDEGMVRRLIERITVYEDHLDFEFKSGLETEVQM